MKTTPRELISQLLSRTEVLSQRINGLNHIIESTPTGATRNILCDLNIGLQASYRAIHTDLQSLQKKLEGVEPEELWDENSEHIEDRLSSLDTVANTDIMRRSKFYQMMLELGYGRLPKSQLPDQGV